jgi:putative ABC transport system substrate-binding protein
MIRRREFITLLGGVTGAWPLAAREQQPERMRRIGVLISLAADDPEGKARLTAFAQGLQELGWSVGRNVHIDYRWAAGDTSRYRSYAAELLGLAPDVILAVGSSAMGPLQATHSVPVVFVQVGDPVGAGFVESLARPGGNATGFTVFEFGISAKWLELLKEVAPQVTRAAVLRDTNIAAGAGQLGAMQSVAPSLGIELRPVAVREAGEIERTVTAFARETNGGLIVTAGAGVATNRGVIIKLAAQHRLQAVYPYRHYVASGGLMSYGPDNIDQYRRAAATLTASSRARNQPISRSKRQQNTS